MAYYARTLAQHTERASVRTAERERETARECEMNTRTNYVNWGDVSRFFYLFIRCALPAFNTHQPKVGQHQATTLVSYTHREIYMLTIFAYYC